MISYDTFLLFQLSYLQNDSVTGQINTDFSTENIVILFDASNCSSDVYKTVPLKNKLLAYFAFRTKNFFTITENDLEVSIILNNGTFHGIFPSSYCNF